MKAKSIMPFLLASMGHAAAAAGGYTAIKDGIIVNTPDANVRLRVISDRMIRVSAVPGGEFPNDASLVVVPVNDAPDYVVDESNGRISITTPEVKAVISESTGAVSFFDKDGNRILQEAQNGRSFTPVCVEGTDGYTVRQLFESLNDDEGLYGLGQHQANEFNYKGKNEELFQYNTKVSVPFVVSTDNYGILWDSYSLCRWGRPDDYRQLGEVFKLYDINGKPGALTGTYVAADGTELVRDEPAIYFEHLIRGDLNHVVNAPKDFNFRNSSVTFEGEIEACQGGDFEFILYYSGYQTIYLRGEKAVDTRWRTSWNPNSYKFSARFEKGERIPIKIEWKPNGSVAYCGLRVYPPADTETKKMMSWWGEMQDMADYYFIYGKNMDEVISGYRTLTGKAPIMPKWAMGYWQSREKYNTKGEVLSTVAEFRRRGIPLDNIVIDWLHWPENAWGSHEFDPRRFPKPKEMVDSVHSMHAHVMVSVWPKFYTSTEHFKEFDRNGWIYQGAIRDSIRDWVGPGYLGSFYDAYAPGARKLFWKQMNDHYMPLGIDAWWMDASEPNIRDCTDISYRKYLTNPTALGPSTKYLNAYALMNAEAIYNGQRGEDPDRRVFLLTRSGFAGLQRYSTATWSGDIATRWEDMEAQIPAGLNFAASGIPYWTMDIGGFCVEDRYVKAQREYDRTGIETDDLREWRELNTRWYQFGAFVPLFRAHGQWPFREVYNIAPDDHPAYKSIVSYTKLRYRLMPYIYSLAGMTYFDDYTIMRPMVMDFADDANIRSIKDQYMFGNAFLVAPVYRYGARSREVYFPKENVWYDFYSGEAISGCGVKTVEAPYERMPLFVRSGSIVPAGGEIQYAAQPSEEPLTLMVYAGRNGKFKLYEDDGISYDYEKGAYSIIPLSYDDKNRTLIVGDRIGNFAGMKESRDFNIVLIDESRPVDARLGAKGIALKYNGKSVTVKL